MSTPTPPVYKIRNWPACNNALKRRGSLTIWFAPKMSWEAILSVPDSPARQAFDAFLAEIRNDLNSGITEAEAVEMLAQHIITRPVFDALFEGHTLTEENPVSRAIQGVLDTLESAHLEKESRDLDEFYQSVCNKAQGIGDNKDKIAAVLFKNYSAGLKTQREAWCFNSSRKELERNIDRAIDYYNGQLAKFEASSISGGAVDADEFMQDAPRHVSWTRALTYDFTRRKPLDVEDGEFVPATYRPIFRQHLYFSRR